MRALLAVILISLSTATLADEWTRDDTIREVIGQTLIVIDWGQTLDISRSCNSDGEFYEKNSILGPCPSRGEVNQYFAATMLLHAGISYMLPTEARLFDSKVNPRAMWQYVTIVYWVDTVHSNYQLGIRMDF